MRKHKEYARLLQVSDSHVTANRESKFFGLATFSVLQAVLTEMQSDADAIPPHAVLFTGDLSQDQSADSYLNIVESLQSFPHEIIWTAGNHDDPAQASKILHRQKHIKYIQSLPCNHWHIIMLNSYLDKQVRGSLDREALDFLNQELSTHANKHILIFLHHHVLPVNSAWLDPLGLNNSEDFFNIVDQHTHIRAVISGHVHQESETVRKGVPFITTPSASVQFLKNSDSFALDTTLMPGYRWFNLYDDGHYETAVVRIAYDEKFIPNPNSKGYCDGDTCSTVA